MGASPTRAVESAPAAHCPLRLERVFADCFLEQFRTRLVGGAPEPLYRPARAPGQLHLLLYREDYFASALHEVSHWCIAGPRRRELVDFGYWYAPDGRSACEQRAFEAVEYQPQAMEWHFARACDYRFRISADNLDDGACGTLDTAPFKARVLEQAREWGAAGLPARAHRFVLGLRREFGRNGPEPEFNLAELD